MKIHTDPFRVVPDDKVDLGIWPTKVDAVYKSKANYKKHLAQRVERLSDQQRLLYASNRHGPPVGIAWLSIAAS
jgi:hypothetical protein